MKLPATNDGEIVWTAYAVPYWTTASVASCRTANQNSSSASCGGKPWQ